MPPRIPLRHLFPALPRTSQPPRTLCRQRLVRLSSTTTTTTTPPPAVLSKLRTDLKTAMRAKDSVRLAVLRALLADITNASKTASPITNDITLLSLLKKKISQSEAAISEFEGAGRADLVEKERGQVRVLEEYAAGVGVMDAESVRAVVRGVVAGMKGKVVMGEVMKVVFGEEGPLEGKAVEKRTVVGVIREELGEK